MKSLKKQAFNIIARNYPLKPETLKQKYGLKDGGDHYLIFTQNQKNEKIAMLCNRII